MLEGTFRGNPANSSAFGCFHDGPERNPRSDTLTYQFADFRNSSDSFRASSAIDALPELRYQLFVTRGCRSAIMRKKIITTPINPLSAAVFLALAVASCSRGVGGVAELGSGPGTDGSSPGPTSATVSKAMSIGPRSDSLLMSTVHIQRTGTQSDSVDIDPSCSSETCAGSNGGIEITNSVDATIETAFSGSANEDTVSTEQGITLVKRTWRSAGGEGQGLVAALGQSGFGVIVETRTQAETPVQMAALTDQEAQRIYAVAYGERSEKRPTAAGTWRGQMAGVTRESVEFLHGDATLTYSISSRGGSLSAEFSNITNLARNAAHSTPTVRFTNIGTDSSGSFSQGIQGNRIQGAFYGSSFEEIAGTFERSGIIAAYGTLKARSSSQRSEPDVGSPGGGNGGSQPATPNPPSSSPAEDSPESSSTAHARAGSVEENSDSFLMTRAILRSNIAKWVPAEFGVSCSARACTMSPGSYNTALWTELTGGDAEITLKELDAYLENAESLSGEPSEDGVSVFNIVGEPLPNQAEGITERISGSFAVLQHSLFGAGQFENFAAATPADQRHLRFGWAAGKLAGSAPATSGVYTGAMTGKDKASGSTTSGNATLTYTVSGTGGSLSANLGIASYSDISVQSSGAFSKSGGTSNNIQGAFYGSDGSEIAGIFESSTHVGAFGATR